MYTKIQKCMYSLKQDRNKQIHYSSNALPCMDTISASSHLADEKKAWHLILFVLVEDDFDLKFAETPHATHLF